MLICSLLSYNFCILQAYIVNLTVIGEVNITELSSTQLCAFMHIKCILDNMVPLRDESSNLRLEDIESVTNDEEVAFQVFVHF